MKRAVHYIPIQFWIVVWVVITGFMLYLEFKFTWENYLFASDSRPIRATVVGKMMKESSGRGGKSYTPYVTYRYYVQNIQVQRKTDVQQATWNETEEGGSIPVKYLARDPTVSRIDFPAEDGVVKGRTSIMIIIGLVVPMGGIAILTSISRQNKCHMRLKKEGISCLGKVTSVEWESVGKGREQPYLQIAFTDNHGCTITGRSWTLWSNQGNDWKPEDPIQVYYDPADSEIFTVDLDSPATRLACN